MLGVATGALKLVAGVFTLCAGGRTVVPPGADGAAPAPFVIDIANNARMLSALRERHDPIDDSLSSSSPRATIEIAPAA